MAIVLQMPEKVVALAVLKGKPPNWYGGYCRRAST